MKIKSLFQCSVCRHEEPKWLGRCPECGSWNSFDETFPSKKAPKKENEALPIPLNAVETREDFRFDSGLGEVNRVLGGGIMKGSAVLIGGEPGIGKSTLMLQMAAQAETQGRILYVSGEESSGQIKTRADRLGIPAQRGERIEVFSGTEVAEILRICDRVKPVLLIIDSIQTLYSEEIGSVPGSVNQIKICSQELIDWVKRKGAALFLVGHVTKEGFIAGPKVIEHMVDTVLYFDTASSDVRILRAAKNRFGSIDEIGIFQMGEQGLSQVQNPARLFLFQREGNSPPGVAVVPVYEGSRVLLVEIQSLVVPAKGGVSRVFSERIDAGRVARMAAVLEKHCQVRFADQDVYVNVGGGIRIGEVGIELPLCLALYSARADLPLPELTAVVGEVSLTGELRPVAHLLRRLRAVKEMSYRRLVHPKDTIVPDLADYCRPVRTIQEAVRSCFV